MFSFVRIFVFALILAFYWAFDLLNFVQAGKIVLLAALSIAAVSSWTTRGREEGVKGRVINFTVVFLFLVIAAFQAFLQDFYGVAHDDLIVTEAIFNTNGSEASEFLLQNIFYILKHVGILLAASLIYWVLLIKMQKRDRLCLPSGGSRPWRLAAFFTFLVLLVHLNPTMRKQNPVLYFPLRYAIWQDRVEEVKKAQERLSAASSSDQALSSLRYGGIGPRTIVFVLGESTTRLNWSMYGYERMTTPKLDSLGKEIMRFQDVLTSDGSTVRSIQKILTPATLKDPEHWQVKPDILTMAEKAGYKTFWITNHGTDTTGILSLFAHNAERFVLTNKGTSRGQGSYDETTLPYLEEALDDPASRKFIIVHLLGGHPAYHYRYPESFAQFDDSGDAVSQGMEAAGRSFWAQEQRNHYDNSMLYADHVIHATLDLCRMKSKQPIAWLFTPDHGEDVGHYSDFVGHNSRVDSMYEIPFLFWHSSDFRLAENDRDSLEKRPYQLDYLDHTLLGLMKVEGDYYDATKDLFSKSFIQQERYVNGHRYMAEDYLGKRIGVLQKAVLSTEVKQVDQKVTRKKEG